MKTLTAVTETCALGLVMMTVPNSSERVDWRCVSTVSGVLSVTRHTAHVMLKYHVHSSAMMMEVLDH